MWEGDKIEVKHSHWLWTECRKAHKYYVIERSESLKNSLQKCLLESQWFPRGQRGKKVKKSKVGKIISKDICFLLSILRGLLWNHEKKSTKGESTPYTLYRKLKEDCIGPVVSGCFLLNEEVDTHGYKVLDI